MLRCALPLACPSESSEKCVVRAGRRHKEGDVSRKGEIMGDKGGWKKGGADDGTVDEFYF